MKNIIKKIFLNMYETFYSIEKFGIRKNIFTESELYDVRYKVNRKGIRK